MPPEHPPSVKTDLQHLNMEAMGSDSAGSLGKAPLRPALVPFL